MSNNSVKKILILAANPLDTVRLSLEREVQAVRTTLQLSANRDRFTIEAKGAVRPEDLQQYMFDVKPQIVHFSGHGMGITTPEHEIPSTRKFTVSSDPNSQPEGLVLEDDDGRSILVSGKTLSNLCALFSKDVVCVLLNACYSQQQAEEIVKYIPYVVGMKREIGDIAARKFSQGFYRAIWDDRSIEEAFASGKNAIELDGIPEELTPVLLKRADAPKPLFDTWRIIPILRKGLSIGLGTTLAISLIRFTGLLQPLELKAYDYTMQRRPSEIQDKIILVIKVIEKDEPDRGKNQRNTLSDENLDKLLELILPIKPKIIVGLDNYLNHQIAPQYKSIKESLESGSLVAACFTRNYDDGKYFKPPDNAISVGFGDIIYDQDNIVRRHLLSMDFSAGYCTPSYALSTVLAHKYLDSSSQKLQLPFQPSQGQIGNKSLIFLNYHMGGYQNFDDRGYQTMLNYRFTNALDDGLESISMKEILTWPRQKIESKIKDRIVLIGTTESYYKDKDIYETPYGTIPGVFLQGQMTSQLVNAALNNRPLIWAYPFWYEIPMLLLTSVTGGLLALCVRNTLVLLGCGGVVIAILCVGSVILLTIAGYWFPLVPSILGFVISCSYATIYPLRAKKFQ
jgi:CHASE2 domain-containing sensor protein